MAMVARVPKGHWELGGLGAGGTKVARVARVAKVARMARVARGGFRLKTFG